MATLLRLTPTGPQWPYSVAQFRTDEPRLSISNDPHPGELASYATLEPPILVFQVQPADPPAYDPSTHRAEEITPVCVDGAWEQAWQLIELPPPTPPSPDYVGFYSSLLSSQAYRSVLEQSMTAATPAIATTIAVFASAIGEAMAGRVNPQALQGAVWLLLSTVTATPADAAEMQGLLEQYYLAGTYTLQPAPTELIRARNPATGAFIADDPTTPDVDEAWVTP